MSFKDKTVWITGASSGIGRALAKKLSGHGARLIISSRRRDALNEVKAECLDSSNLVRVLPMDLSKRETLSAKAEQAWEMFGRIDMLFNNGGISQRSLAIETDMAVVRKVMEVNFFGYIALTKALLPRMMERQTGHIIVTSSVMGKFSTRMRSTYSASKHALHGWFNSLRQEVYGSNVKVTLACPGFIKTNVSFNAVTGDGSAYDKMAPGQQNGMSAQACAGKMLRGIEKGKEEIYIGEKEILGVYLNRLEPCLFRSVLHHVNVI